MKHKGEKIFCVVDRKEIPAERINRGKGAVTCSKVCGSRLNAIRRARADQKKCRHCGAPSDAAERKEFLKWRRSRGEKKAGRGRPEGSRAEHSILHDLLLLVCYVVPKKVIKAWTPEQRKLAETWAAKTHLRASDNPVRVPPRPSFLDGYEFKAKHETGTVFDIVPRVRGAAGGGD